MSEDRDMVAWESELREELAALKADHSHPDNNGEGQPCKYINFGLWNCGVIDDC